MGCESVGLGVKRCWKTVVVDIQKEIRFWVSYNMNINIKFRVCGACRKICRTGDGLVVHRRSYVIMKEDG